VADQLPLNVLMVAVDENGRRRRRHSRSDRVSDFHGTRVRELRLVTQL
jgi:hypothetical protein